MTQLILVYLDFLMDAAQRVHIQLHKLHLVEFNWDLNIVLLIGVENIKFIYLNKDDQIQLVIIIILYD